MVSKKDLWDRCLQEASEGIMLADFDAKDVEGLAQALYSFEMESRRKAYKDKLKFIKKNRVLSRKASRSL